MLFWSSQSQWEPRLLWGSLRLESVILLFKAKGPYLSHSKQKPEPESGSPQTLTPLVFLTSTTGLVVSRLLFPLPEILFPLVWIRIFYHSGLLKSLPEAPSAQYETTPNISFTFSSLLYGPPLPDTIIHSAVCVKHARYV